MGNMIRLRDHTTFVLADLRKHIPHSEKMSDAHVIEYILMREAERLLKAKEDSSSLHNAAIVESELSPLIISSG